MTRLTALAVGWSTFRKMRALLVARAGLKCSLAWLIFGIVAALLAGPAANTDWLQWGGPQGDFTVDSQKLALGGRNLGQGELACGWLGRAPPTPRFSHADTF